MHQWEVKTIITPGKITRKRCMRLKAALQEKIGEVLGVKSVVCCKMCEECDSPKIEKTQRRSVSKAKMEERKRRRKIMELPPGEFEKKLEEIIQPPQEECVAELVNLTQEEIDRWNNGKPRRGWPVIHFSSMFDKNE